MTPAGEEGRSGPAPDLSSRLTPEPAAAAAPAACGCPCGGTVSAGAAGTRARASGQVDPGGDGARARSGAGLGSETEPPVTCGPGQESLRTKVSPQPQQHKMADTSPRTSRDSALGPPRPLLRSPRRASLPAHPASHDIIPFRCLPPLYPRTRPCPSPGCRAGGGGAAAGRRRLRARGPGLTSCVGVE